MNCFNSRSGRLMPISAANRKICAKCGADVTFARRASDPKGRYLCLPCAKASEASQSARPVPADNQRVAKEDSLSLLAQLAEAKPATTAGPVGIKSPPIAKTQQNICRRFQVTERRLLSKAHWLMQERMQKYLLLAGVLVVAGAFSQPCLQAIRQRGV